MEFGIGKMSHANNGNREKTCNGSNKIPVQERKFIYT